MTSGLCIQPYLQQRVSVQPLLSLLLDDIKSWRRFYQLHVFLLLLLVISVIGQNKVS